MIRSTCGLALTTLLSTASAGFAHAQGPGSHAIKVRSCDLADSLLGPMTHGGSVWVYHKVPSDSFKLYATSRRFSATLERAGTGPQAYPVPALMFVVEGRAGEAMLAARPRRPRVDLILDDSLRLQLGDGAVGNYSGPRTSTMAPVAALADPLITIQLARATKAAAAIDAVTVRLEKSDLQNFNLLYRFATCDTIRF